jgi:hypothetical protein
MVIGKEFAWAHIPKTGGCTTLALFQMFPELLESIDPHDSNTKHSLFRDRERQIEGKMLVCTIRRLPEWMLDRAMHETLEGLWPDYKPRPMRSPAQIAATQFADGWISYMTDFGRLKIDRWLRLEHLREDFFEFVSQFTEVGEEQRKRIFELPREHVVDYDVEPLHWFTPEQIRLMYENNPLWHAVEREAYKVWPRLPAPGEAVQVPAHEHEHEHGHDH